MYFFLPKKKKNPHVFIEAPLAGHDISPVNLNVILEGQARFEPNLRGQIL